MNKLYDFLIVGAGIFGLTTAIELAKQKYRVAILNPDGIPHPLAASTDISKVVRMEYGRDREYALMASRAIEGWKAWNELFGESLYHETGLLMASKSPLSENKDGFIWQSYESVTSLGYSLEILDGQAMQQRFPQWNHEQYVAGVFNPVAGYAASEKAIAVLANYARTLGVEICEGQLVHTIYYENGKVTGVKTREGSTFSCGHLIVSAGAHTPYLLPELHDKMYASGHAVFHVLPEYPHLFQAPDFTVFMADISETGWYGFPLHLAEGVVKLGHHGIGHRMHPDKDDRRITDTEVDDFRSFIAKTLPDLAKAPIVYTRRCLYTDTLDGHFWIDQHPEKQGLTIASGGSGHGFKMGPELGKIVAATALGEAHAYSDRYRWREFSAQAVNMEAARAKAKK